jgi:uncharacterized DUF497 family protein
MPTGLSFEWDDGKDSLNVAKHGVSFAYTVAVFVDDRHADFDASHPLDGERRRKAVGMIEGRLFTVVYTVRGEFLRIISARRANTQEVRLYDDR